jgi:nicotinamide riboside transporter PnuC
MSWTWLLTVASIIGVVANIYMQPWCFAIWLFTNLAWMIVDWKKGLKSQAFLFAVYMVLAVWGLIKWMGG